MYALVRSDRHSPKSTWLPHMPPRVPRSGLAIRPMSPSFDHLVGTGEQRGWHREAKRLGSREVYIEVELGRLLYRQIGGPFALENSIHVTSRTPIRVGRVDAIRHEPTADGKELIGINGGQAMSRRERDVSSRWPIPAAPAPRTKPPFTERANSLTLRSISAASRTSSGL